MKNPLRKLTWLQPKNMANHGSKTCLFVFNLLFASLSMVFDLGNVKVGFIFAHSDFRVQ